MEPKYISDLTIYEHELGCALEKWQVVYAGDRLLTYGYNLDIGDVLKKLGFDVNRVKLPYNIDTIDTEPTDRLEDFPKAIQYID